MIQALQRDLIDEQSLLADRRPDGAPRHVRRYESGPNFVEITPSVEGLATVHDRDVSRTIRFKAYDLRLTATNRGTDGRGYEQLKAAQERLKGTMITTNIITGGQEEPDGFGLIEREERP